MKLIIRPRKFNSLLKSQEINQKSYFDKKINFLDKKNEINLKIQEKKYFSSNLIQNNLIQNNKNYIENVLSKIIYTAQNLETLNIINQIEMDNKPLVIKELIQFDFKKLTVFGYENLKLLRIPISKLKNLTSICLDLNNNNIGFAGAKEISSILSKLPILDNLSIELSYDKIGANGTSILSNSISNFTNINIRTAGNRNILCLFSDKQYAVF